MGLLPSSWLNQVFLTLAITLSSVTNAIPLQAQEFDVMKALPGKTTKIIEVTSDENALTFFLKEFGSHLDIKQIRKARSGQGFHPHLSSEFIEMAKMFTATLGTWQFANSLQLANQDVNPRKTEIFMAQTTNHLAWIQKSLYLPDLERTVSLTTTVLSLTNTQTVLEPVPHGFTIFTEDLDRTYPNFVGTSDSWVSIAEREGVTGLQNRLNEFWVNNAQDLGPRINYQAGPAPYTRRYLRLRLMPILKSYLLASTIRLQALMEKNALSQWQKLQEWPNKERAKRSLIRLCGTWKWKIHNHQNHQDHLTMMVFPPPDKIGVMNPPPAQVEIRGNTVFIKWEFQAGYQEDSLLLSSRDRQLEGTFVNSRGSHGVITGMKVKPCPFP